MIKIITNMAIKSRITEEDAERLYPVMVLYCEQRPVSMNDLSGAIMENLNCGISWQDIRRWLVDGLEK